MVESTAGLTRDRVTTLGNLENAFHPLAGAGKNRIGQQRQRHHVAEKRKHLSRG